ncbi:MAG: hypothetical protein LBI48_01910 [Burkholderiaceae bacterium]|jgi:hypothetical protein|nr:hypothetical protein [Burkholderiaceae bacterium]
MTADIKLPPLPGAAIAQNGAFGSWSAWSAQQMRNYARAAVLADRQARPAVVKQSLTTETAAKADRYTTRCSFCGVQSNNQRPGDGCHACLCGAMRPVEGAA